MMLKFRDEADPNASIRQIHVLRDLQPDGHVTRVSNYKSGVTSKTCK